MLTLLKDRVIKGSFMTKDRVIKGCFMIKIRLPFQSINKDILYGETTYIIPRPIPAKATRLPNEIKVYFNPFFIAFYLLVVFRGTKIVNLSETA